MAISMSQKKEVFLKLKSNSSSVAYEGLVEIRSNITKSREGIKVLRESSALKDLVGFLEKPNEKILDVTLSILGNCCLDQECRRKVVTYGIVGPLVSVLYNIEKDSIQCRACRLVGNLAQEPDVAELLHKEGILVAVVAVLDTDSRNSVATKQMAIRALRMLWSVENRREEMLNCNAVRAVALLLPLSEENRGQQELLQATIKTLAVFTHHRSEQCAQQAQGDGLGFQHLASFIANNSLKYSALTCICNLCYTSSTRPALGNVGAVKIIINELLNHKENNSALRTELVMALCYLCRESVNRAKIRRAGGLPLLLEIIRNSSKASLQPFVLHALIQFVYDELSLEELLKEGLVTVLVNIVTEFVKEHGKVHKKSSERPEPQMNIQKNSSDNDGDISSNSKKQSTPASRGFCEKSLSNDVNTNAEREQEISRRRRFRANSPSYQAVVQEQGNSNRERHGSFSSETRCSHAAICTHRCRDDDDISQITRIHCSPDYYTFGDWSPGSASSMCFSPDASPPQRKMWPATPSPPPTSSDGGFSPPSSPLSPYYIDETDYPEVYSPVCCELPDDDEETDHECDDIDCIISQDTAEDNSGEPVTKDELLSIESKEQNPKTNIKLYDGELSPVLILLSRISHMEKPIEDMAAHSTLIALLDYITLIKDPQPRASRILFRIIRNQYYFVPLLQQRFVLTVQSRLCQPRHTTCWYCNEFKSIGQSLFSQISMLAHSGYGEGELAYQLLKGGESVQKLFAVSIPYIVRMQKILYKLLMDCGGLKTLMQILDNSVENNDLESYVPTSLKLLAAALDVANPYHRSEETHNHDDKYPQHLDEIDYGSIIIPGAKKASDDAVFLLLDDGNSVQVSKTYLSLQSPMFEAMFRGGFKESSEDYVPLPGITHDCLINLLRIMKLGHVPSSIPDIDLSTSLELVAVLDRFLIPGSEQLTEMVIAKFLSPSTVVDIYIRCMEAGDVCHFHTLRHDTVRFILTSDTAQEKTDKIFNNLLQSSYRKQLITDIAGILQERLVHFHCKPSRFLSWHTEEKIL